MAKAVISSSSVTATSGSMTRNSALLALPTILSTKPLRWRASGTLNLKTIWYLCFSSSVDRALQAWSRSFASPTKLVPLSTASIMGRFRLERKRSKTSRKDSVTSPVKSCKCVQHVKTSWYLCLLVCPMASSPWKDQLRPGLCPEKHNSCHLGCGFQRLGLFLLSHDLAPKSLHFTQSLSTLRTASLPRVIQKFFRTSASTCSVPAIWWIRDRVHALNSLSGWVVALFLSPIFWCTQVVPES